MAGYTAVRLAKDDVALLPLELAHAEDYCRIMNHPDVGKYTNMPIPFERQHFDEIFPKTRQPVPVLSWMIAYQNKICGAINAFDQRNSGVFQGGYWLLPEFRKKGIGHQALSLAKEFLLKECNAQRIQALIEPDNVPSRALAESCGYINEGLLRRFYPSRSRGLIDVCMYAYVNEAG